MAGHGAPHVLALHSEQEAPLHPIRLILFGYLHCPPARTAPPSRRPPTATSVQPPYVGLHVAPRVQRPGTGVSAEPRTFTFPLQAAVSVLALPQGEHRGQLARADQGPCALHAGSSYAAGECRSAIVTRHRDRLLLLPPVANARGRVGREASLGGLGRVPVPGRRGAG